MIKIRTENGFHRVANSMKENVNQTSRLILYKASVYGTSANFATAMAKFIIPTFHIKFIKK